MKRLLKVVNYCKYYIEYDKSSNKKNELSKLNLYAIIQNEKIYKYSLNSETLSLVEVLNKKIDKILAGKLLRNIPYNKKEKWRMTQIFTNDFNYHKVYSILHEMDKFLDFSFYGDANKIFLKKFDRLYEYWILTKILEKLLMVYHWQPESNMDIRTFIYSFFHSIAEIDKSGKNEHKGYPIISMYKNNCRIGCKYTNDVKKLKLSIYYDSKIGLSLDINDKELNDIESKRALKLSPDFLFKVSLDENKDLQDTTYIFIADAKCKNYTEMGNKSWINEDLIGVAANKYTCRISKCLKKIISSAYIIHPDNAIDNMNPNNYLGKFVTYDAYADNRFFNYLEKSNQVDYPVKTNEINKGGKRNSLIGGFYMLPFDINAEQHNYSDNNLTLYFEQMFEYFVGAWSECWNCGSHNVTEEIHHTSTGYQKYYYHCKDCDAFWIKTHCEDCHDTIIKHYKNYFVEENKSPWFVRCPHCDPHIDNDKY